MTTKAQEKSERKKVTRSAIVEYWEALIDECEIGVDWSEADKRCWCCGTRKASLEHCHIVPHSLGGKSAPENLVVLCKACHLDSPDVACPEAMWAWIKDHQNGFYDLPRGVWFAMKRLADRGALNFDGSQDEFESRLKTAIGKVSTHQGRIAKSTVEWLLGYAFAGTSDGHID